MPREHEQQATTASQSGAAQAQELETETGSERSRAAFSQYVGGLDGGGSTLTLPKGADYVVKAADLQGDADATWDAIARDNGMTGAVLKSFNADEGTKAAVELQEGAVIYLPSADEILFGQLYTLHGDYKKAEAEYGELKAGPNVKVMRAARARASGKTGEGYGVYGVGGSDDKIGYFLSPNKELAGASSRRTEKVDGQVNYKVVWVNDWKCSTFMNDVAYQAGYKPAQFSTDRGTKYNTAGTAHRSKSYKEVTAAAARPGDLFQKFGGAGSNESHNAVLSTLVARTPAGEGLEEWVFGIIGAEQDRAAEGERSYTVKAGTNETTGDLVLRFLRPVKPR